MASVLLVFLAPQAMIWWSRRTSSGKISFLDCAVSVAIGSANPFLNSPIALQHAVRQKQHAVASSTNPYGGTQFVVVSGIAKSSSPDAINRSRLLNSFPFLFISLFGKVVCGG